VIATQPATPPPAPAPAASEPKKIHTVTIRSDQSGGADAGAAAAPQHGATRSAKMSAAKPSGPAPAPAPSGSQPLSLAPDSQGDVAAPTPAPAPPQAPPRSRAHAAVANATPAGGAAETASSGGYAVQVSSQRSEADAHAAFRALRNKFPTQLGGREPIVRRADLGAKGIYYRAMVGPFASMEEAAGMCSNLKAAGGTCLVQRN
jgi:cell division septation protein DedD